MNAERRIARKLFKLISTDPKAGYKVYKNAAKKAEDLIYALSVDEIERLSYMIMATEHGRFYPVVQLRWEDEHLARYFVQNNVAVIR